MIGHPASLLGGQLSVWRGKMEQSAYKRFSSHDGTSLAYRTAGDGRRVVLLHGFTVS